MLITSVAVGNNQLKRHLDTGINQAHLWFKRMLRNEE